MGLTRIRAEQISDIDYKQAVRVLTATNVTLAAGAPSTVDYEKLVALAFAAIVELRQEIVVLKGI
jgi:hypothetical protein